MHYANANPKLLVVFHSRSGKTRKVAEAIAKASAADLEEIRDPGERKGLYGRLRSAVEGVFGREPRICPTVADPAGYDVVIVGTSASDGTISSAVQSYLEQHRRSLPEVAFFITFGGRRAPRVLAQMEELCRKAPLAELALPEGYMVEHPAVCIGEFCEALLRAWEQKGRDHRSTA